MREMENKFNNFVEVERMLQFLGIQEVTTKRQKKNGTREFELPIKDSWSGKKIRVASFASGYVRNQGKSTRSNFQLNKRCESEPQYYEILEWDSKADMNCKRTGKYRKFTTRTCKLISNEVERLEYLISYCLKNYYIKQANMIEDGKFVPKWKYENELQYARKLEDKACNPEVKVIINGHRYNVT